MMKELGPIVASVSERFAAATRYDLVLTLIPSAFVVAVLFGHLLSLPPQAAVAAASVVAALAVGDALFLNPPRPDG